jgi:octaprenyl-diphosphate synthase
MSSQALESAMALVKDEFKLFEEDIFSLLSSSVEIVKEVSEYLIGSGGKRIRPLLMMLSARACGYQGLDHIPLASVTELIHTATLLHDDVIDEGAIRRGKISTNKRWSNSISVLIGDYILAQAMTRLAQTNNMWFLQDLSKVVTKMAEGELLQLLQTQKPSFSKDLYFSIIEKKTASLFSWCCRTGAMFGEEPERREKLFKALSDYGYFFGLAFQITDDILDFTGDPSVTGKGLFLDLEEGKITLPLLLAVLEKQELKDDIFVILNSPFEERQNQRILALVEQIRVCDAFEKSKKVAQQLVDKAILMLGELSDSCFKSSLESLARYLVERVS